MASGNEVRRQRKEDHSVVSGKPCRVLTAPTGFVPTATIRKGNEDTVVDLPADDAFLKSIRHFVDCIGDENTRKERYQMISRQAELVDEFKKLAGWS